jgi:pimeloyl-ACP methyl ester carboxylesterase
MVRDVRGLLEHLGIGTIDLCGYSMGAMTALTFSARDAAARSVVLGGAGDRFARSVVNQQANRISDALLAEDPSAITDPVAAASPAQFRRCVDVIARHVAAG